MPEIKLQTEEKEAIKKRLVEYCEEKFDLKLEQFDAEFFADFVIDELGVAVYNAGIDEAIRTLQDASEHIQEEIELKRIL